MIVIIHFIPIHILGLMKGSLIMSFRENGIKFVDLHFHALTHRNFRYLWFWQCVSLIGTWAQTIVQSWLVLTLTGSPLLLGFVSAVQFLPFTCFSLFAGAIIDRFPKKYILLVTQAFSMLLAFILAFLVFTNTVTYTSVVIVAFFLGLANSFDLPTRQSFNIEIVGKEDIMKWPYICRSYLWAITDGNYPIC
jgi:MFS family permease